MNDLLENAARICRDCERVSPSMAVSTVQQLLDICCSIRIQCCRLRDDFSEESASLLTEVMIMGPLV